MHTSQGTDTASTIAIADAISLLASKLADAAEARRVLVERAQIGDLLAFAARAHGPFEGESLNENDWPIPADLWQRLGDHSDDEWRRGDLTAAQDGDSYAELQQDFGTPLRLIGVRVDVATLNRVADSLPVDWVNAHDAIDMLLPMYGKRMGSAAGRALAKRAHSGLLKTRARLFKWEEAEDGAYRSRLKVEREAQFAILPKGFWWADGHEALEQNWVTGDFATWIDETYHWQAFGTEFARCDIVAMLPKPIAGEAGEANPERPSGAAQTSEGVSISLSGDPGRPSKGSQFYLAEFERRSNEGICESSLAEEAKALLDWLKNTQPSAAPPTVKTISNRIRRSYNARKTPPEISARN